MDFTFLEKRPKPFYMKGGRRTGRELALKILYQTEFQSLPKDKELRSFLEGFFEEEDYSQKHKDFCFEILKGLRNHKEAIDQTIKAHSQKWDIKRMSLVDLNIMRIAVFEMLYEKDVPERVILNEALELAKTFSGRRSPAFINGILDQILKDRISSEKGS